MGLKDSSAGGAVHVRRTVGLQGLLITTVLATDPESDPKLCGEMCRRLRSDHICCHADPVFRGLVSTISRLLENTNEKRTMYHSVEPSHHKLGIQPDKRYPRHVDTPPVADEGEIGN